MAIEFTVTSASSPVDSDQAKWSVTTAPSSDPVSWLEAKSHLRLDIDTEQSYVETLIKAATDYAQDAMSMALMRQTITANFYAGEPLILPRTPLMEIQSVTDAGGNAVEWEIRHDGHRTELLPKSSASYPIQVVYVAGHATAEEIPASIRLAILQHVATMHANRESIADRTKTVVPHSLADFYRLKRRSAGVG